MSETIEVVAMIQKLVQNGEKRDLNKNTRFQNEGCLKIKIVIEISHLPTSKTSFAL